MTYPKHVVVPHDATTQVVPIAAIPAGWNDAWVNLAVNASEPNPFAEHWFMRPAIRHLGKITSGHMIAVWQDEMLLGLLPVAKAQRYGRLPIGHIENWMHYHCFYGAPLIRAGHEAVFWSAILKVLDNAPWATNFMHLVCLDAKGVALETLGKVRRADIVHRSERAMLQSNMDPETYLAANVRPKKRKEIKRLRSRLDELGAVVFETLAADGPVSEWSSDFLLLEASGWKGREGSALGGSPATAAFFRQVVSGAHAAGKLDMLKVTLDGKPIAMLVNFLTAPGSFSFKIAFDEDYARFSPGVLIKIENLKTLYRPEILWTDSCAVEDHPMINSLWSERRGIVRVTVPLAGVRRQTVFHGARLVESMAARIRGRR